MIAHSPSRASRQSVQLLFVSLLLTGCGRGADSVEVVVEATSLPSGFEADIVSPYPLAESATTSQSAQWTYHVESLSTLKIGWQLQLRRLDDNRIVDAKAMDLGLVLEDVVVPLDRIARIRFGYPYSERESIDWPVGFAFYEVEVTQRDGTTTTTNCTSMPHCYF